MQKETRTESEESLVEGFPEGVVERGGRLFREVTIVAADGSERVQVRPVARTLEEAKARRWDYYHPEGGWILEGYKWAKDRTPESIMADTSQGSPLSVEEQERRKEEVLRNG